LDVKQVVTERGWDCQANWLELAEPKVWKA
jgi:hypothetical protein